MSALKSRYIEYTIIILFLPNSSTAFYHDTWSCDSVTVTCDIMLNSNPMSSK